VPSNKRQRELAHRRAERQAARRAAERARRRKRRTLMGLTIGGVAAAVVLILLFVTVFNDDDKSPDDAAASASATPSADENAFKSFPVACGGKRPKEAKPQSFGKEPPKQTIDTKKTYTITFKTSCGVLEGTLEAAKAPKTVNSFSFLAEKNFYDGSICHRMNEKPEFAFLQCGDPTGTGSGQAPGYTLPTENVEGAKYTRGTIAMANTGAPNSTGSQFFILDQDTAVLQPSYTVVGHITKGLENLDKIIAVGTDGAFEPSPGGGHPKQAVYLEDVTVTAK
jgi:peptidyl-prolyl cis-trans isomerase B (cyclophilin B)